MAKFFNDVKNGGNVTALREVKKGAIAEVKTAKNNPMYWVNQLNKLARKNAFVDGTNISELGRAIREYAINLGYNVPANNPFTLYPFTRVNDVVCYKYTKKGNKSMVKNGAFAIIEDVVLWRNVTLSENGLINAYTYILNQGAKDSDISAREYQKELNKASKKERAHAKKMLKKMQENALKAFRAGEMCAEEFASIMAKVA